MIRRMLLVLAFAFVAAGAGAAAQDAGTDLSDDAEAIALARRIEKDVEKLRGLEFKEPTKVGVYTVDELRKLVKSEMAQEMPSREVAMIQRALVRLGLVPAGLDLMKLMSDVLTEQIAGFYNPEKKELFLVKRDDDSELMKKMEVMLMTHELVHALQDQHFDLIGLGLEKKDDDDRVTALRSVIEGDATFAMMLAPNSGLGDVTPGAVAMALRMMPTTLKGMKPLMKMSGSSGADSGIPGMDQLLEAPAYLGDDMIFQYYGGAKFCAALHQRKGSGGMKAIDAAFRNPPLSTEQILHPKKYFGDSPDWPTRVGLPDLGEALGEGWSKGWENTLGELHVRTLANEFALRRVRRIHSGWDGDRYALWVKDGAPDALVWLSTWDTVRDATQFAAALEEIAAKRNDGVELAEKDGVSRAVRKDGSALALQVRGKHVAWLDGVPAEAVDAVLARLRDAATFVDQTPAKSGGK